jgi:hypothetical protein
MEKTNLEKIATDESGWETLFFNKNTKNIGRKLIQIVKFTVVENQN